jgi:hypothetical protein
MNIYTKRVFMGCSLFTLSEDMDLCPNRIVDWSNMNYVHIKTASRLDAAVAIPLGTFWHVHRSSMTPPLPELPLDIFMI